MTRARDNSFNPFNNNYEGKNIIINGGMDVWQRGTSFTGITAGNTFVADRWSTGTAGAYNIYVSRQATNDSTNLPNIQYCLRYGRTSGNTNLNWNTLSTSLETVNSIPFAGKTITLSFYARAGANFSSTGNGISSFLLSGTGIDQNINVSYTGAAYGYGGHTLTSTWQRFTNTYTVPLNATELSISFQYVPTGTAGANDWYEITGVQLELGSSPTPFSRSGGDVEGELSKCQRYYWRTSADAANTYASFGTGIIYNSTQSWCQVKTPVTMRIPAASVDYLSGSIAVQEIPYGPLYSASAIGLDNNAISKDFISFYTTHSSGTTAYRPLRLIGNNNANGYLGFSAEL